MDVGLTIAGLITVALAFGHATIGLRWILPGIPRESLPATAIGPPARSEAMIRVTWHIVTIFALASGTMLLLLGLLPEAEPRVVLLRGFAAMWAAATLMAFYVVRARPRTILRLPVPLLWAVVALLCWLASA